MTRLQQALHRWAKPTSPGTRIPDRHFIALDNAGYLDHEKSDGEEIPLSETGEEAMRALGYMPPFWERAS